MNAITEWVCIGVVIVLRLAQLALMGAAIVVIGRLW
jgi:hypothetical protein